MFNKKATCAWLLSKGASPLIRGYGPFLTAADRGLVEILSMFIQQHQGPEDVLSAAFKSSQSTNLRASVSETQRVEVVRMLLDAGMQETLRT